MMDITRNQFFYAGLVLLLLGVQFRMVESFDLNKHLTEVLLEQSGKPLNQINNATQTLTQSEASLVKPKNVPPTRLARMVARLRRQRADPSQLGDEEGGHVTARGAGFQRLQPTLRAYANDA